MQTANPEKLKFSHSFVVLAYKESPYLEECLKSLLCQSLKSDIVVASSTPTNFLQKCCKKFNLSLIINPESPSSISKDWNFAYRQAKTDYVTLAHQDDIYCKYYAEKIFQGDNNFSIAFTDYHEIKHGKLRKRSLNLVIKKLLLLPFFFKSNISDMYVKKAILSLGSPICCPSVTYHKSLTGDFRFNEEFSINMDWDAWLAIASKDGSFKYINKAMVRHRIHAGSETTAGFSSCRRQQEDLRIFRRLWGKCIGSLLARIYSWSYNSNA